VPQADFSEFGQLTEAFWNFCELVVINIQNAQICELAYALRQRSELVVIQMNFCEL